MNSSPSLIQSVRGPILLITLGALMTIDHFGPYSFCRTWPVLIIVVGCLKLFERIGVRRPDSGLSGPGGNVS